jgi:hypothetical protein
MDRHYGETELLSCRLCIQSGEFFQHRRADELKVRAFEGEPIPRPPFGFVEFERFAKRVVLLLFVSSAEASEPRVRSSSKTPVRRLQRAAASTARASTPSDGGRACETDLPWVESYLYGTVRKVVRRRLWTRVDNMTINKPNSIMA